MKTPYPPTSLEPKPGRIEKQCDRCKGAFWVIPSKVNRLKTCPKPECSKIPLMERFMSKILKTEGDHWIWQGAISSNGYGFIRGENRESLRAHRVAYELFIGKIPPGLFACHKRHVCVARKDCCNPYHINPGTPKQNSDDCVADGRHADFRGEKSPCALISDQQALFIKQSRWTHTADALAAQCGISPGTVESIWHGSSHKHLPPCPPRPDDRKTSRDFTELERFERQVTKDGPIHPELGQCWKWHGGRTMRVVGGAQIARTAGYILLKGQPPSDRRAVMKCGNECVNPDHVEWLTQAEICARSESNRMRRKGEDVNTSKLSPEKVLSVFEKFIAGESMASIARFFGITGQNNIRKILKRESWAHVEIPENLLTEIRLRV